MFSHHVRRRESEREAVCASDKERYSAVESDCEDNNAGVLTEVQWTDNAMGVTGGGLYDRGPRETYDARRDKLTARGRNWVRLEPYDGIAQQRETL
eukprot:6224974-Pyramimonas_sp.AAC.1